ncbi:serine/threonine protein kinase [Streptomyces sp. ST2-7A]|nr:serine/threonine protein kinase [Streptomyces sp. ST2-7A]
MGTVWRARDTALEREVAIKEVRPPEGALDAPGAARLRERVLREARALARIAHPHVVTVHHIVDAGPFPWIVMELLPGRTLRDRIAEGPVPVAEAVRHGLGVLAALRAAHAAGILHRDVKPANVLLRPDGSAVLTDFGIAAVHDGPALTMEGQIIGSPEYMAPERVRGGADLPAGDLWSLGALLYELVENRSPMRRGTLTATLLAVVEDPVPPATRAGALEPLLAALLVKDPAARPDAERVAEALRRAGAETASGAATAPPVPAASTGAVPPALVPTYLPPPVVLAADAPAATGRRGTRTVTVVAAAVLIAGGAVLLPSLWHGGEGSPGSGGIGSGVTPGAGAGDEEDPGADTGAGDAGADDIGAGGPDPDGGPAGRENSDPDPTDHDAETPGTDSPGTGGDIGTTDPVGTGPGAVPDAGDTPSGWVAQLFSEPVSSGIEARDRRLAAVRAEVPEARLLLSDDHASLNPGYWVVYAPGPFADGHAAVAFCAERGRTGSNDCVGRFLSGDAADRDLVCHPRAGGNGRCVRW